LWQGRFCYSSRVTDGFIPTLLGMAVTGRRKKKVESGNYIIKMRKIKEY
jgi:hypothetical protein